ncbi:DUF1576 domain-containing protein [Erysipelothrix sp. HDW6C]|uniref:DUF1576 domain-containing protein n=1 Tax=Erysipelothrix sp. HDW6C TaxID=2714930 RepID=UPI00140B8F21|nr:DUF1576 domain-containing protein [Erysipelothrix sp. HDW6C]QIK69221.1 DUF1576 domain-containing protein [Erysipelothrix sp. HDW6C]
MKQKTIKFLVISSLLPLVVSFFIASPFEIFNGMTRIITESSVLITDYIAIGGLGAALFNVGILTLMAIIIIYISGAAINGTAIASVYLMGSFAFFGKNVFNVVPILLGTFLYSKLTKKDYRDIVHMSLLATSFAPIVTEIILFVPLSDPLRTIAGIVVGMSVGFVIKPVADNLFKVHEGFNLYNTGFSIGIIATLYVSIMKSYGYEPRQRLILDVGHTEAFAYILATLFIVMFVAGFLGNNRSLKSYWKLLKETGYQHNDFLENFGLSTVLMNMGINGILCLVYVLFIAKGELNGPIMGGILTVVGFSGLGKHARNILPIFIGVVLGGLTKSWTLDQPTILFAALFGTALAPIAGYFGFAWGIVASFINSSVVLNSGQLHSGMNLYNTGFSVGIVASVLVPILKKIKNKEISIEI